MQTLQTVHVLFNLTLRRTVSGCFEISIFARLYSFTFLAVSAVAKTASRSRSQQIYKESIALGDFNHQMPITVSVTRPKKAYFH